MDVAALIGAIEGRKDYLRQIAHVEVLPERLGRFAEPATPLSEQLAEMLRARGIDQLYTHQAAALEAARSGRDWVVVTGTASGKTLCYNLPILEACLADDRARALYLFPTKALAQDQLKGLLELVGAGVGKQRACAGRGSPDPARAPDRRSPNMPVRPAVGRFGEVGDLRRAPLGDACQAPLGDLRRAPCATINPGVYDGDTPTAQRRRIRSEANLVLSNPDMLHAAILPYHPKWAALFSELRFVVIDEVHTYRGILGAHVSAVLRRLMRVCEHYGSRPTFLCASATIANPGELAGRLLGRDVEVIDDDGSPRGRKYFVLWNPAPLGRDQLARRSAADDAVTWLAEAIQRDGQALAFTRTRQAAELIHRYTREVLENERSPLADQVRAYRGGYLPNERRQIEDDLFAGRLRGVAATNALELGIDVGSLDVALLVNYPGTIASTWQQAGRSGRRHDESLAVLLAGNDPVDQYLLRHPEYFFAQSPEHAVVDADNPYVLARHLPAAAFELPLEAVDMTRFGPLAAPIAEALAHEGRLSEVEGNYFSPGGQNPAYGVSLRHMSDQTFSIVRMRNAAPSGYPGLRNENLNEHEVIANVDAISAPELVYPQAVYLHDGQTYLVRELDLAGRIAYVERRETDYYTQAVLESSVTIRDQRAGRALQSGSSLRDENPTTAEPRLGETCHDTHVGYGDVDVAWQTVGFKKIKFSTRENVGYGAVDIPAQNLATTAVWLAPGDALRQAMKRSGLVASEGVAGLRNLAVVALPLVAMCDSRDLGGVVDSKNLGRTTMILYDRYPGGLGYSQRGFERIVEVLAICHDLVRTCPCGDGCPSCVGLPNLRPAIHSDPDLTRGHPMPNKLATTRLLELLCG